MNKKGFTLIELMIVVAIIGVLAAIAIPKFCRLVDKSNCNAGHQDACDRIAAQDKGQLEQAQKYGQAPEAAVAAPAEPRITIKGRVVKAEKEDSTTGPAQYNGVLSLDNGTSMGFTVNDMVVEGTTICIEVSQDRMKADNLVLCK